MLFPLLLVGGGLTGASMKANKELSPLTAHGSNQPGTFVQGMILGGLLGRSLKLEPEITRRR